MLTDLKATLQPVSADNYQYDKMACAIEFLYKHFKDQPSLEEVAAHVNMSAFHFQRQFSEWAGISPKRFLQFLTTGYLKEHLTSFDNLIEAADEAGLSSQSRVYDLFVTLEAVTPQEYKAQGQGLNIRYGFHPTPFGPVIIGITDRGVCHLAFVQFGEKQATAELKVIWPKASLTLDQEGTGHIAEMIFNRKPDPDNKLNVLVKGTNFQVKVWNALLQIPSGEVTTYGALAAKIGEPKAVRAVGTAVGANPLAFLIPCHRVIRRNLEIGDYHWGTERKKAILGWEMSKASEVA